MPPHCDTRNGPVVKAAKQALETGNINYVVIWIPRESEKELRDIFEKTLRARKAGNDAKEVADDWFFENAIRLHRAGEGEPFTGMKPAGLDEGPVVPRAEHAIETGDARDAIGFVLHAIEEDLEDRFNDVLAKKRYEVNDVNAGRAFIQAYINFVVYSHHLYASVIEGGSHGHGGAEKKGHHH